MLDLFEQHFIMIKSGGIHRVQGTTPVVGHNWRIRMNDERYITTQLNLYKSWKTTIDMEMLSQA